MANEIANVANLHLRILMNSELNSNKPETSRIAIDHQTNFIYPLVI
jgi:hypothetical protein